MNVQPIILAAGKGTRMALDGVPKVLAPLAGKTIIEHLLQRIDPAGFLPAAIVVGYHGEQVRDQLGSDYVYVEQTEQLGTGHALQVCEEELAGTAEYILLMNGDHPLWEAATMQELVETHIRGGSSCVSLVTSPN